MGGTFDPPHVGHLLAASDACDLLPVDRLIFIPAAQQPLKQHQPSSAPEHRLRMVELMAEGDPRFSVDKIEIERTGLSFTVDTLEEYAQRFPDSERYFLLGVDAFALLDQWREAARVVSLAHLERGHDEPGVTLADLENPSLKGLLRRVVSKIFGVEIKGWCSEFETRDAAGRQVGAHRAG